MVKLPACLGRRETVSGWAIFYLNAENKNRTASNTVLSSYHTAQGHGRLEASHPRYIQSTSK